MNLNQEARSLRLELGWTQEQVAKAIKNKYGYECSTAGICNMEKSRGARQSRALATYAVMTLQEKIKERDDVLEWLKERHERIENAL